MTNDRVIEHLTKRGVTVKNHFQAVDESTADSIRRAVKREGERAKARQAEKKAPKTKTKAAPKKKPESKLDAEAPTETPAATKKPAKEAVSAPEETEKQVIEVPEGATVKEFADAVGREPNDLIKILIKSLWKWRNKKLWMLRRR